jgi:hypothetical protein
MDGWPHDGMGGPERDESPVGRGWRWVVASAVTLACYGLCWAGLTAGRMPDSSSQGVATVLAAVVLAVMGAWAEREKNEQEEKPRNSKAKQRDFGAKRAAVSAEDPPAIRGRLAVVTQWAALASGLVALISGLATSPATVISQNGTVSQSDQPPHIVGIPSDIVAIVAAAAVVIIAVCTLRRRVRQLLSWEIASLVVMIASGFQCANYIADVTLLSTSNSIDAIGSIVLGLDTFIAGLVVLLLIKVLIWPARRSRDNR